MSHELIPEVSLNSISESMQTLPLFSNTMLKTPEINVKHCENWKLKNTFGNFAEKCIERLFMSQIGALKYMANYSGDRSDRLNILEDKTRNAYYRIITLPSLLCILLKGLSFRAKDRIQNRKSKKLLSCEIPASMSSGFLQIFAIKCIQFRFAQIMENSCWRTCPQFYESRNQNEAVLTQIEYLIQIMNFNSVLLIYSKKNKFTFISISIFTLLSAYIRLILRESSLDVKQASRIYTYKLK